MTAIEQLTLLAVLAFRVTVAFRAADSGPLRMLIGVGAGGGGAADAAGDGVGLGLGEGLGDGDVVDADGDSVGKANTGDGEVCRVATAGLPAGRLAEGGCANPAATSMAITTADQPAAARTLFDERKIGSRVLEPATLNARRIAATERSPKIPRAGFVGSWTIQATITRYAKMAITAFSRLSRRKPGTCLYQALAAIRSLGSATCSGFWFGAW